MSKRSPHCFIARGLCVLLLLVALFGGCTVAEAQTPLTITTTSPLFPADAGIGYSTFFSATGGSGQGYTWLPVGALPAGFNLDSGGNLTGTPTVAGNLTIGVEVIDLGNPTNTVNGTFILPVNSLPILFTTPSQLPSGTVGAPYSQELTVTGGTPPYAWELNDTQLPPGLSLDSTTCPPFDRGLSRTKRGPAVARQVRPLNLRSRVRPAQANACLILGTPTTSGTTTFNILVGDDYGQTANATFSIAINQPPVISTTSLAIGTVGVAYTQNLTVTGGTAPYAWTITAGILPAGLTLNSSTGQISGTPTANGTTSLTFVVTDVNGASSLPVTLFLTVDPALAITNISPLPAGTVGINYVQTLTATGGSGQYNWTVSVGTLPTGLTLNSGNGQISGTPTAAVISSFTVQVIDTNRATTTKPFSLTINPAPLITSNSPLPAGTVGINYSQTLALNGGTSPANWTLTTGTLPAGLTLNSATGQISGTPNTTGVSNFTIQVKDANGAIATKPFALTINAAPVITTNSPLPGGTVGVSYSQTLGVSGGTPPFFWTLTAGSLPAGLSLNSSNGQITGVPNTSGTANFTVQVTDNNQASATKSFALSTNTNLTITTSSPLPAGAVGAIYSLPLIAAGGTAPYTWSLTAGTLPAGLSLNSTAGRIGGTPTAAGNSNFIIQVNDSVGQTATKSFTLPVTAPLVITSTSPLAGGTVGANYVQTLQASGGATPYTWSLIGGVLPAGLSLNSVSGTISGIPTTAGPAKFTIQVSDANQTIATGAFALTINGGPTITNTALPSGAVGVTYSQTISVSGGTAPYTFVASAGTLPAGLSLNSTSGQISGTPTASGVSSFTIQVTDSSKATASKQFSLTINSHLTITSVSPLPGGMANVNYSFMFQAAGGATPYIWVMSTGALPAGILLNSANGQISGKPMAGSTANFTMQVTDSNGAMASAPFSLTIASNPAITTPTLPPPVLGSTYSVQLAATGSGAPFTWSLSTGSLPGGLAISSGGTISGRPTTPGAFTFTVQVTDASNSAATLTYTLTVPQVAATVTIQVPAGTPLPQQQITIAATLQKAYPVDLAGELVLQFTPNPATPIADPSIQFSTGGDTVAFQIPAGQTSAVFSQSQLAVQTGSIAGAILLTANLTAGGAPVTLSNDPDVTVTVPQAPPGISSVTIQQLSSGFNVVVAGYSNTREITQATFTFAAQPGSQLQGTSFTPSGVGTAFQTWFASDASAAFGSQFLYTQPFNITAGSVSTLQSVTVTLTNSAGASSTMSANF